MIFLSTSNIMSYIKFTYRYEFSYPDGIKMIATIPNLLKVNKNKGQYTLVHINFSPVYSHTETYTQNKMVRGFNGSTYTFHNFDHIQSFNFPAPRNNETMAQVHKWNKVLKWKLNEKYQSKCQKHLFIKDLGTL